MVGGVLSITIRDSHLCFGVWGGDEILFKFFSCYSVIYLCYFLAFFLFGSISVIIESLLWLYLTC